MPSAAWSDGMMMLIMNKFSAVFPYTAAVLLGLLTPLGFAPYYQFWLMPLIFAALIVLWQNRLPRAVRLAYLFGLTAYTAQFYWIDTALHDIAGLPQIYALPLTLLLPAYLALFPAAAVWLWRKSQNRRPENGLHGIFALPVFWTLAEFARERLLTGFGWGALGYSQIADDAPLAGFAVLGGIHLLTFATALSGSLMAQMYANRRRWPLYAVCIAALCAIGLAARQYDFTQTNGKNSSVALAQGNIPQSLKFDSGAFWPTVERYFEQTAAGRADIIVLPETAIPAFQQDLPPDLLPELAKQAARNGSALAVGIARYSNPERTGYHNAMLLADAAEQPDNWAFYAKNHLVPFGEYKPLPALTEPLYRLMNMPLADFQRGGAAQTPFNMNGQKVAFNICYEDGFGDELIASARQSTLLANASNMAWYGKSNAMYQQLQQSQARALELGRYMIRATNTGLTAVIDHKGRLTASLPPDTAGVLRSNIQGYSGQTPYMMLGGSWPLIILLGIAAAGLLYRRKPNQ